MSPWLSFALFVLAVAVTVVVGNLVFVAWDGLHAAMAGGTIGLLWPWRFPWSKR